MRPLANSSIRPTTNKVDRSPNRYLLAAKTDLSAHGNRSPERRRAMNPRTRLRGQKRIRIRDGSNPIKLGLVCFVTSPRALTATIECKIRDLGNTYAVILSRPSRMFQTTRLATVFHPPFFTGRDQYNPELHPSKSVIRRIGLLVVLSIISPFTTSGMSRYSTQTLPYIESHIATSRYQIFLLTVTIYFPTQTCHSPQFIRRMQNLRTYHTLHTSNLRGNFQCPFNSPPSPELANSNVLLAHNCEDAVSR